MPLHAALGIVKDEPHILAVKKRRGIDVGRAEKLSSRFALSLASGRAPCFCHIPNLRMDCAFSVKILT